MSERTLRGITIKVSVLTCYNTKKNYIKITMFLLWPTLLITKLYLMSLIFLIPPCTYVIELFFD